MALPVERDALALPPFRPRLPWWGGDLQTLRNLLRPPAIDLGRRPAERLELPMADGSGDRLVARLHEPVPGTTVRPMVTLIHGLTGCQDSAYIRQSAAAFLAAGYAVVRLNLRGAGPSRPLCRFHYHAGRSDDLRDALAGLGRLRPELVASGVFLVGYSLGGNMLIKLLAEAADRWPPQLPAILAAASVSAPIDLKGTQVRMMRPRNWLYHRYLLRRMREESLAPAAEVTKEERRAARLARSVYEFDDRFVAPRNGFGDAETYYRVNSGLRFLGRVRVPMLLVHALDDPWIPARAYLDYPWRDNPALLPLIARRGGHVGFHGRGSAMPWHDRAALRFFARCCGQAIPDA